MSEGKAELALESAPEEGEGLDLGLLETIGHLRESVPPSLEAIVFAVATAEAQVDLWGRWNRDDDRKPLEEKCQLLASQANGRLMTDEDGWRWFMEAVNGRDGIVHAKADSEERPISVVSEPKQSTRALRACAGVRRVLVELAQHHLGHANIDITMNRYGHLLPDQFNDLAAQLDAAHGQGTA